MTYEEEKNILEENIFDKGYPRKILEMAKIFEKDGVRKMARKPWPIDLSG